MVTANLSLPEIAENQALKYLTHNEALRVLDALLPGVVQSKTLRTPPEHFPGQVYIVANNANGAWKGHESKLACSISDAWIFVSPQKDWRMFVSEGQCTYNFDGVMWQPLLLSRQIHDLGQLSGVVEIDVSLSGTQQGILVGDIRLVLKPLTENIAVSTMLQLHQDEQGLHQVTWPDSLKFSEGQSPALTLAPGAIDVMQISHCANNQGFLLHEMGLNFLPPITKS